MECVEAALKKSFRGETTTKPSPHGAFDDFVVVSVQNVDDCFVDGLLDFSNDDVQEDEQQQEQERVPNDVVEVKPSANAKKNDSFVSAFDHNCPHPSTTAELTLPVYF